MAIDLNEFKNLDPNAIGTWPLAFRVIVIILVSAAVLGLGLWFDTKGQVEKLEKARKVENKLKKEFVEKQAKAANLDAYKQQMKEMEESFGTMLRQLPSKTEVAELLVDVTQTGLASGLEFVLFKPAKEQPQDFYAELPIQIKVNGTYHEFGAFVSGVASLPRIVTLHNISITDNKGLLSMDASAKTYRYLDEEEIASAQAKTSKKRRKKR